MFPADGFSPVCRSYVSLRAAVVSDWLAVGAALQRVQQMLHDTASGRRPVLL